MAHFKKEFLSFFKDLAKNNSTEWFNTNRKTYEIEVKKPFADLVEEVITKIQKFEPEIKIKAGDAIFRINKDVRFSKEKTPYNTHVSANISKYGRKDKTYPGFYFQLSHDKITIIGGAYMVEPDDLQKLRKHIAKNLKSFAATYIDKEFKSKFGVLQGEKHKRLTDEFKALELKEPLIANKQFYYTAQIDSKSILKDSFTDELMEYYKAGRKMNQFLREGMK